jgi:hypothetical protein
MASTYSTSLRIQLIGTGDQAGVWGTTTNTNLGTLIEQAITGYRTISVAGLTTYTLSSLNGTSDEARNAVLNFTGALSANCTVTAPAVNKVYIVSNNTSGGYGIIMTTGAGTTVTIPMGQIFIVYSDGTNFYFASNFNSSAVVITGGTINGTTIGNITPAAGSFTTLNTSGQATFGGTGAITLPVGTTAQEPGTPTTGMIRFNSDTSGFEGYNGSNWGSIGGGASANGAVYENTQIISSNYTMTTGNNGESVGPITVNSGITVTIPSGSRWLVL